MEDDSRFRVSAADFKLVWTPESMTRSKRPTPGPLILDSRLQQLLPHFRPFSKQVLLKSNKFKLR